VQAGETGNGSQASPYGTVTEAVTSLGQSTRIYICGGETFEGSIDLPSNVSVYGGLDCAGWSFKTTNPKPEILGSADTPAITIGGEGSGSLSFLRVRSPDAVAAGASSIAVLVSTAETTIQDCDLRAGAGATGVTGADEAQTNTLAGGDGSDGSPALACSDGANNSGGPQAMNDCGAGGQSIGAQGGFSTPSQGTDGLIGQTGAAGQGGDGQPAAGMWDCAVGTGGGGNNGSAGSPGSPGSLKGTITSSGFVGHAGGAGGIGSPGQGGGGGGAAKGLTDCNGATAGSPPQSGASGGSGGAGGCGGNGASGGGGGGGASFALVSLNATVSLIDGALTVGAGGAGGPGGLGQPGADGGDGGAGGNDPTLTDGCSGGDGGQGGHGGGGGGGRGGHAAALVFIGAAPAQSGTVTFTAGSAGGGGTGQGNGIDAGNNGLNGTGCEAMNFSEEPEACAR